MRGAALPADQRRVFRVSLIVAMGAVALPMVVLIVRLLRTRYLATSDFALIQLRVGDVGGSQTPLVGVYSRFGWNHPGPMLFYVLAAPFRLFGSDGPALRASGTLVDLVAATASVALIGRRARAGALGWPGLALGTVVILVVLRALGGEFLGAPWNPNLVVLPLLVLALVTWSVLCRDHWMFPIGVALASFATQTHVGATGVAAALLVGGGVALLVDTSRGRVNRPGRLVVGSVLVAAVCWLPAVVDQASSSGGNLSALWRYWTTEHASVVGWARAGRIVAAQLTLPAPWVTGHEQVAPFAGGLGPDSHVPWVLGLVIGAGLVAWRRRDRESVALCVVVLLMAGSAWASIARIVDEPYGYLVRWMWLVGALAWLAIGWTAMRAFGAGSRARTTPSATTPAGVSPTSRLRWSSVVGSVVVGLCALALVVATTLSGLHAGPPSPRSERALLRLDRKLISAARRAETPLIVEGAASLGSAELASGIVARLQQAGVRAGLKSELAWQVGVDHVVDPRDARAVWVAALDDEVAAYRADPHYRLVASYDPLNMHERAELDRLGALLHAGNASELLRARRWVARHPRRWARYSELATRGVLAAVFVTTPNRVGRAPQGRSLIPPAAR